MTNLLKEKKVIRTKLESDNAVSFQSESTASFIPAGRSSFGRRKKRCGSRKSINRRSNSRTANSVCSSKLPTEPINMARWKSTTVPPSLSAVLAQHSTAKSTESKPGRKVVAGQSTLPTNPAMPRKPQVFAQNQQQSQQQQQHVKTYYSTFLPPSCPQRRFSLDSNSTHSSSTPMIFMERTRSSPQLGRYRRTLKTLH